MTSRRPLLLATRNPGKLRELRPLFAAAGLALIDLQEARIRLDPEEEGIEAFDGFDENARAKARYFHRRSGLPVVAEDSGLEVAALGGAPGVRSRRWSGRADLDGAALDEANNRELERCLAGAGDRRARYVCVAVCLDGTREHVARGTVEGHIAAAPRGAGGFGYDPWFIPAEGDGRTFAEMTAAEKATLSHRGRAFASLFGMVAGTAERD